MTTASEGSAEKGLHDNPEYNEYDINGRKIATPDKKPKEGDEDEDDEDDDDDGIEGLDSKISSNFLIFR